MNTLKKFQISPTPEFERKLNKVSLFLWGIALGMIVAVTFIASIIK